MVEEEGFHEYYILGSFKNPVSVLDDSIVYNVLSSNKNIDGVEVMRFKKIYDPKKIESALGISEIEHLRDTYAEQDDAQKVLKFELYLKEVNDIMRFLSSDEGKLDICILKISKKTPNPLYIPDAESMSDRLFEQIQNRFLNQKLIYNKLYDDRDLIDDPGYKTVEFKELDVTDLFDRYVEFIDLIGRLRKDYMIGSYKLLFKNPKNLPLVDNENSVMEYKIFRLVSAKSREKLLGIQLKKFQDYSYEMRERGARFIDKVENSKKNNTPLLIVNAFLLNFYDTEEFYPHAHLKQIYNFGEEETHFDKISSVLQDKVTLSIKIL